MPDIKNLHAAVNALAQSFAQQGRERLKRRELVAEDFKRLADTGFLLTGVSAEHGGYWRSLSASTRSYCALVRNLAQADPSLALVSAMHPSVMGVWADRAAVPEPYAAAWRQQRQALFELAKSGHWVGTIASEPGSGGDLSATRAVVELDDQGRCLLTGDKHMGSGSGIMSVMLTTAKGAGETEPDLFLLDVRERPWDGSAGIRLVRAWDAYGMAATQSHAFHYDRIPVERCAWPGRVAELAVPAVILAGCLFAAVTVGILDSAIREARSILQKRAKGLSAYEQVAWTRSTNEYWLAQQALAGMLTAVEAGQDAAVGVHRGKLVIAELAEALMQGVVRVIGGSSLAGAMPFGQWLQDVRALGFLRPPWALLYEHLFEASWQEADCYQDLL